jgi:hypothetical protein
VRLDLISSEKEQVRAQFDKDSDQLEAIGLKRKPEYKPPERRSNSGGGEGEPRKLLPSKSIM